MPEIQDDPSASTARFRAFAERMDHEAASPRRGRSSAGRLTLAVVGVVCVAIVVVVLAVTL